MYSEQLEQLIKSVIADGVITDKERAVLHKKAAAENVDADEIDVYVDGLIANTKSAELAENKKETQRKCPKCNEYIDATNLVCPSCGYEINTERIHGSVQKLFDLLQEEDRRYEKEVDTYNERNSAEKISGKDEDGHKSALLREQQLNLKQKHEANIKSIIEDFPIPNDHEAMLEFLSTGISQVKNVNLKRRVKIVGIETIVAVILAIMTFFSADKGDGAASVVAVFCIFVVVAACSFLHLPNYKSDAWRNKCLQVLTKAKLAFAHDPRRLAMYTQFEEKLKKWQWN